MVIFLFRKNVLSLQCSIKNNNKKKGKYVYTTRKIQSNEKII